MPGQRRRSLESTQRDEGALDLTGRLVVVADDDAGVVHQVRGGLEGQGYRFLEVSDGRQVLTAVRAERPDLLIMDVEMPGLGGVEVCRIVKANQGTAGFGFIPIILMTARRGGGKVEGLELGADDYLVKPFDMPELSARVKSMLRLKALQDALLERNRELDRANQELEERRQELLALSRTDGLTGLFNRRHFDERLSAEFARATRQEAPLACLLLDIDHFKRINDTYGHPFGDEVIREVAAAARRAMKDGDVLARYGGEEIIALLTGASEPEATERAEQIRRTVERLRLTCRSAGEETEVGCTVSIGVSGAPRGSVQTPGDLVQSADGALYEAKQTGRNRVCASKA